MRVFSAQPYHNFTRDLNSALIDMGYDVVLKSEEWIGPNFFSNKKEQKDYYERLKSEKPGVNKRWVEEVKKAHEKKKVDLFVSATDMLITYPDTIEQIKNLGIPTLNVTHDDIPESYFNEMCQDLALAFDFNWTFQLDAIKSYKKIGANVIHYPVGANPHLFKPSNCEREFDVMFLGKNKGYRRKILKVIVDEGIDARAWGDGWRDIRTIIGLNLYELRASQGKLQKSFDLFLSELIWRIRHFGRINKIFGYYLSFDEMVKMYSRSRITLNFPGYFEVSGDLDINIDSDKAPKGLKGRDAEAPMSGAFYLTEYSEDIVKMYEVGKEIDVYRTIPELVEKIKYYLDNPTEAESIRKAGRERALRDYTWAKGFEKVFYEMDLVN